MGEILTRNGLFSLLNLSRLCFHQGSLRRKLLDICDRLAMRFFCCFGSPKLRLSFSQNRECWLSHLVIDWMRCYRPVIRCPIVLWFLQWVCFWILWFCLLFLLQRLIIHVDVETRRELWLLLYDRCKWVEVFLNVLTKWWLCCHFHLSIVVGYLETILVHIFIENVTVVLRYRAISISDLFEGWRYLLIQCLQCCFPMR